MNIALSFYRLPHFPKRPSKLVCLLCLCEYGLEQRERGKKGEKWRRVESKGTESTTKKERKDTEGEGKKKRKKKIDSACFAAAGGAGSDGD